jgi:hypothetical protein
MKRARTGSKTTVMLIGWLPSILFAFSVSSPPLVHLVRPAHSRRWNRWCAGLRHFCQDQAHVRPSHDLACVRATLDSFQLTYIFRSFLSLPDSFAEMLYDLAEPFEPFKSMMLPRSPLTDTELTLGSLPQHVVVPGRWSYVASLPVRLFAIQADSYLGLLASVGSRSISSNSFLLSTESN